MEKINDSNYLEKLFIDEAKPALERHSGGAAMVAFSIGGKIYTTAAGTTWGDFVAEHSDILRVDTYRYEKNEVTQTADTMKYVCYPDKTTVRIYETITANTEYIYYNRYGA